MTTFSIAFYWGWDLERVKFLGLMCQVLGLFLFIALWWNQDRSWRVSRWLVAAHLVLLAIIRYAQWLVFTLISPSPSSEMRAFMMRSGISGLVLCLAFIAFLILDRRKKWVTFPHFSPEDWSRARPTPTQWFGLIAALYALWSPFIPSPVNPGLSTFAWGFPTSFGVTLTPVLLFLGGLILAGSRKPSRVPLIWFGIGAAVSSILSDPIALHGILIAASGLLMAAIGLFADRSRY